MANFPRLGLRRGVTSPSGNCNDSAMYTKSISMPLCFKSKNKITYHWPTDVNTGLTCKRFRCSCWTRRCWSYSGQESVHTSTLSPISYTSARNWVVVAPHRKSIPCPDPEMNRIAYSDARNWMESVEWHTLVLFVYYWFEKLLLPFDGMKEDA